MRSVEQIQLSLGIEDSMVPIYELVPILEGFQGITLSLNDTLNKVYSCGFDKVSVNVQGLEHGSFRIPFSIDKFSERIFCPLVTTVIGNLIFWYLTADKPQIDVQLSNDQILVERAEVLRNKMTKDSVNKIARTVINSDKISDLSLKYIDDNNQEVAVRIDKNRLARMISVQWKVRYDGKVRPMKMNDLGFLELIGRRDIAFSKGDIITCDIQITETTEVDGSVKTKYVIVQVHDFPHYHRVVNIDGQNINNN